MEAAFREALKRAEKILTQQPGDKNKLYAMHASEVECIGKGKARARYEFGVKASIATTHERCKGGQWVLGAIRRNAIEPVISHMKQDGLLERSHLAGPDGNVINVILCAAGHNMRLLARWIRLLLLILLTKIRSQGEKYPRQKLKQITC